jgi:hypothetical protein
VCTSDDSGAPPSPSWYFEPPLLTATFPLGITSSDLIVQGGLVPGSRYKLTLACDDGTGKRGVSQIDLRVNMPPAGPKCSVCRESAGGAECETNGVAVLDRYWVFSLICIYVVFIWAGMHICVCMYVTSWHECSSVLLCDTSSTLMKYHSRRE